MNGTHIASHITEWELQWVELIQFLLQSLILIHEMHLPKLKTLIFLTSTFGLTSSRQEGLDQDQPQPPDIWFYSEVYLPNTAL